MKLLREKIGPLCVYLIDQGVNLVVTLLLLLMLVYGSYSIWDNQRVLTKGQATVYQTYKPKSKEGPTFEELKNKNQEVFAWITVYGTKIDYPIVQSKDNKKYLNTDSFGNYQMSGSIFMDYRNNQNFTDFNSIVYGHHMAESAMFGDLDKFQSKDFFNKHANGNLYYNHKNHGVKFFAFLNVDAFDPLIYKTPIVGKEESEKYLAALKTQISRDIKVASKDRLIILSTCSTDTTNGRYVLVGRIMDEEIPVPKGFQENGNGEARLIFKMMNFLDSFHLKNQTRLMLFLILFLLILFWYMLLVIKRKKQEKGGEYEIKKS